LESFHDRLAHFANSGMRDSLSDSLHLAGTARYNLAIRHKRQLLTLEKTKRSKMPAAWEKIVPHWNQSELIYINNIANDVGCPPPFPKAERLTNDTGERFFAEYIKSVKPLIGRCNEDNCWCDICRIIIGNDTLPAKITYLDETDASPTLTTTTTVADRQPQGQQRHNN